MGSCPEGNQMSNSGNSELNRSFRNMVLKGSGLVWIFAIGVALLAFTGSAFGQYTVQPMKIELPVRPGQLVKSKLEIRSLDPNEVHTVDLSVVELSQNIEGDWRIIEPNADLNDPNSPNFGFDMSKLSTCSKWISMRPNSVDLSPLGVSPVEVTLRVPRGIRGFYGAGIMASVRPRPDMTDVSLVLRFLIPVLVEIQGRPMQHKITTNDVGMELYDPPGESPATTLLSMSVENIGGTFPRLYPVARLWSFADGHWRILTTTEFQDIGIIPGAKLNLKTNINRSLPSGKYKLAGVVYVDGRRTKRVEKEIDFVGDPTITQVTADAPLDLFPSDVSIESMPGATRSAVIKVYNGSDETVNVQATLGLPHVLYNATLDNVRGVDLSCADWVTVTPEKFTLRGEGGMQQVRINTKMPVSTTTYPCYYGVLGLWGSYPDGRNAGLTSAKICVNNREIQVAPKAEALKLIPSATEGSQYLIVASFGNFGVVHFKPISCKAGVTAITGGVPRSSALLTSKETGLMLPLETRDFSGLMDFSHLPADLYRLSAALDYAPNVRATKQIAIRVSIEGGRRVVDVVGIQEELGEIVEVKW